MLNDPLVGSPVILSVEKNNPPDSRYREVLAYMHQLGGEYDWGDDEKCLKFLADLKWAKGFKCKRCRNKKYCQGKLLYSRRCTCCGYTESATSDTIFHHLKFPIVKAFYMVFIIVHFNNKITLREISKALNLRLATCCLFKQKIMKASPDLNSGPFLILFKLTMNYPLK